MNDEYMIIYYNYNTGCHYYKVYKEDLNNELDILREEHGVIELFYVGIDEVYEVLGNKERI